MNYFRRQLWMGFSKDEWYNVIKNSFEKKINQFRCNIGLYWRITSKFYCKDICAHSGTNGQMCIWTLAKENFLSSNLTIWQGFLIIIEIKRKLENRLRFPIVDELLWALQKVVYGGLPSLNFQTDRDITIFPLFNNLQNQF